MTFLGLDLSTQQLKVCVTDAALRLHATYAVEFDLLYAARYGVRKGVLQDPDSGAVWSPVAMWMEAVDEVFGQMRADGFRFDEVVAVSGACQQHGLVFWTERVHHALRTLDPCQPLAPQLAPALAWDASPNWQDHSTGPETAEFEACGGGAAGLAATTGSRAHYRFTGVQIRKLARRGPPGVYAATDRILLVSSFLASLLTGRVVSIDESDACGMNLYDIDRRQWDEGLVAAAAGVHPDVDGVSDTAAAAGVQALRHKLGEVQPVGHAAVGCVSPYLVERYGFRASTKVYPFTGDNNATILALPLAPGDVMVSLGTSTTALVVGNTYRPRPVYHQFMHPTMGNHYMGMICYCNGALAREKVRDALGGSEWDRFNSVLDAHPRFPHRLGVYFPLGEIVPNAAAQTVRYTWDGHGLVPAEFLAQEDVLLIVDLQALSCRLRVGPMISTAHDAALPALLVPFAPLVTDGEEQAPALLVARPARCYFVGGASRNRLLVARMAAVLGATDGSYVADEPNACALGGAYKASWSHEQELGGAPEPYAHYIDRLYDRERLQPVAVADADARWEEYFEGCGLLAQIEQTLA